MPHCVLMHLAHACPVCSPSADTAADAGRVDVAVQLDWVPLVEEGAQVATDERTLLSALNQTVPMGSDGWRFRTVVREVFRRRSVCTCCQ
jgi:hypothetical protein